MQMIKPKEAIPVRISGDRLTMCLAEEEADQESGIGSGSSTCGSAASAEDVESPKSVVAAASSLAPGGAWRKSDGECFHIQVKRLKEEESHLGEDVCKKTFSSVDDDDVVLLSKTGILPASPLGGIRTPQSSSS